MSNYPSSSPMRNALRLFVIACFLASVGAVRAEELKLEARLVWGTNEEKPSSNCKPVDPALFDKLHGAFKWKNYFEITNQISSIPVGKTRDIKMSDRCTLHVKNLGHSRIEVNCIGDGKEVHKGAYTLTPPKWLDLGGNDKDNTAWFIGFRSTHIDPKAISKN